MKESQDNQIGRVNLPPSWCGSICRNAMNEVCVEHCAIVRDCSAFEIKPNLKLGDMPRFPLKQSEEMTKDEKFTSVTVYLAKVVDYLQGVEDEPIVTPVRRNNDRSGSRPLPKNLKSEDVLPNLPEGDPAYPAGAERTCEEIRPPEVVGDKNREG